MSANWKRIGIAAVAAVTLALTSQVQALAAKGGNPNPGGGGHTDVGGNNLSFPVIWGDSEGAGLTLPGSELQASLTVPYTETAIESCPEDMYAFAQKVPGNVWQAESVVATAPVHIDEIDWGDSLESIDMKVGRPVRVELSLYKILEMGTSMTGYDMVMLANPSSKDEVQGVCAADTDPTDLVVTGDGSTIASYASPEATVYSPQGRLVIQQVEPDGEYTWNGSSWDGAGAVVALSFSGELNVGGKVIYGLSEGGWKPTAIGTYRVTFSLPTTSEVQFDGDTIIRIAGEEITAAEEGETGGDAVVDVANNLTYIDIAVVAGGGGGGGKPIR